MKNPAHLFRKEVREGNWYNINEQALFKYFYLNLKLIY